MILALILLELIYLFIGALIFKTVLWVLSCFFALILYIIAVKMICSECKKRTAKVLMTALSTAVFAAFLIWSKCQGYFLIPLIIYDTGLLLSLLADSIKYKILYITISAAIGALVLL